MGLLSNGTPLPWEKAKKHSEYVRTNGIQQLLNVYHQVKDRHRDCLLWGDEIEYMVFTFDSEKKKVFLSLRGSEVLENLENDKECSSSWKPEYAKYMLESTPLDPYGPNLKNLLDVEKNMKWRKSCAQKYLAENEFLLCVTNFPLLGAQCQFLYPGYEPGSGVNSHSLFIPDEAISSHARFGTLTANIRKRRGSKVEINVPIYRDLNTPKPFMESFPEPKHFPEDGYQAAKPDHIYMDCMCFGMGCSCLQMTFQASSIQEARNIYDQLGVLTPIMLALTAATPIFRGYLADVDCRWDIISKSVDDRTEEERGILPLSNDRYRISKSRYASISSFISQHPSMKDKYNDIDLAYDENVYKQLTDAGFDNLLALHFSHLFIRDPLVIYEELINQDNSQSSDHFENIQSTNWQTMRFKPPPPNSKIGWRVEFRSMEIQLTEYENAAFAIFIVLLSRAILSFNLNLYIPISKVDENMRTSQKRNAVREQKFHFRKNVFQKNQPKLYSSHFNQEQLPAFKYESPKPESFLSNGDYFNGHGLDNDDFELMSINEIINGQSHQNDSFPGLISIVDSYLNSMSVDYETRIKLNGYLNLIKMRSSGQLVTTATWIRDFVKSHPDYKNDSVVSESINYDLCMAMKRISDGDLVPAELFGRDKQCCSPNLNE